MAKKKSKKKSNTPLFLKVTTGVLSIIVVFEIIAQISGTSMIVSILKMTGLVPDTRMEQYSEQPQVVYNDLLYLSYIDSLGNEDMLIPDKPVNNRNIVKMLMEEAGVPQDVIKSWKIPQKNSIRELFVEMYQNNRILLPQEGLPLLFEFKEGVVKTGYILFGRYEPSKNENIVDFCAVVTSASKLWADRSKIMYIQTDKVTGQPEIIHGFLENIPKISYFGCGVPGDDLEGTYQRIIRPEKNKRKF